jgi:TIR domain
MSARRPTLLLTVVWHPSGEEAGEIAKATFKLLCDDPKQPAARGLRLPVRFRTAVAAKRKHLTPPPATVDLEAAERSVVVVLLDADLLVSKGWKEYVGDLCAQADRSPNHLVLQVLLHKNPPRDWPGSDRQFIRVAAEADRDLRRQVVLNRLTHTLCRLLDPEGTGVEAKGVKIFVSHAKQDGLDVTERLRRFINGVTALKQFYDAADIPEGAPWAELLHREARTCALLVVQTDAYASREWCRMEVLGAKAAGSPVVVLAAVQRGEDRAFPYLGNVPVVRWIGDPTDLELEQLLGVMLREELRSRYFLHRLSDLCAMNQIDVPEPVFTYPPELLTLLPFVSADPGTRQVLVYPDPPLGTEEVRVLQQYYSGLEPVTPTMLVAM